MVAIPPAAPPPAPEDQNNPLLMRAELPLTDPHPTPHPDTDSGVLDIHSQVAGVVNKGTSDTAIRPGTDDIVLDRPAQRVHVEAGTAEVINDADKIVLAHLPDGSHPADAARVRAAVAQRRGMAGQNLHELVERACAELPPKKQMSVRELAKYIAEYGLAAPSEATRAVKETVQAKRTGIRHAIGAGALAVGAVVGAAAYIDHNNKEQEAKRLAMEIQKEPDAEIRAIDKEIETLEMMESPSRNDILRLGAIKAKRAGLLAKNGRLDEAIRGINAAKETNNISYLEMSRICIELAKVGRTEEALRLIRENNDDKPIYKKSTFDLYAEALIRMNDKMSFDRKNKEKALEAGRNALRSEIVRSPTDNSNPPWQTVNSLIVQAFTEHFNGLTDEASNSLKEARRQIEAAIAATSQRDALHDWHLNRIKDAEDRIKRNELPGYEYFAVLESSYKAPVEGDGQ